MKRERKILEPDFVMETVDGRIIFEVKLSHELKKKIKKETLMTSGTIPSI